MLQLLVRGSFLASATSAAFTAYKPYCWIACRTSLASATLSCTPRHLEGGHSHNPMTLSDCYAGDEVFLTSLACSLNSTFIGPDAIPT
jgi:hypothetical protein